MNSRVEQHGNIEIGIVEHEGREYIAMGSVVTNTHCTAYLGKNRQLTKWDGTVIGRWSVASSWPTPRSYVSSRMYQIEAWVGAALYTGRSAGEGMVFNGRRVARQLRQLKLTA